MEQAIEPLLLVGHILAKSGKNYVSFPSNRSFYLIDKQSGGNHTTQRRNGLGRIRL